MPVQPAAILAAIGFAVLIVFQLALALGAPLGRAAWGGAHERLPAGLRIGSAVAAFVWTLAAIVVLGHAGVVDLPLPERVLAVATWGLVPLLAAGAVMNAASRSRWERFGWAPVAAMLAALCGVVAISA